MASNDNHKQPPHDVHTRGLLFDGGSLFARDQEHPAMKQRVLFEMRVSFLVVV